MLYGVFWKRVECYSFPSVDGLCSDPQVFEHNVVSSQVLVHCIDGGDAPVLRIVLLLYQRFPSVQPHVARDARTALKQFCYFVFVEVLKHWSVSDFCVSIFGRADPPAIKIDLPTVRLIYSGTVQPKMSIDPREIELLPAMMST